MTWNRNAAVLDEIYFNKSHFEISRERNRKGELAPLFLFILKGKREDLVRMKRETSSLQP